MSDEYEGVLWVRTSNISQSSDSPRALGTVPTFAVAQRVLFDPLTLCSALWRLGGGPIAGLICALLLLLLFLNYSGAYTSDYYTGYEYKKDDYTSILTELGTLFQRDTINGA